MSIQFILNGKTQTVDVNPNMPLLWVLRDTLGMTGTKFGCGMALCGACTVHMDGEATRSCITPISSVTGKKITTIEALPPRLQSSARMRARNKCWPWRPWKWEVRHERRHDKNLEGCKRNPHPRCGSPQLPQNRGGGGGRPGDRILSSWTL